MSPAPAHEPFLRAICEAPDDDAPRLVFADWLDENGDTERAEFIRQHVQLARQPEVADLDRRCAELFQANGRRWIADLPGPAGLWAEFAISGSPGSRGIRLQFEVGGERGESVYENTWVEFTPGLGDWDRGFPSAVYVQGSSDTFLAHVDRVAEFVPVHRLHLLNLDDPAALVRRIAGLPFLSKLRELILPFSLPDEAAEALAYSPFAPGLRQVSLVADRMTDRAGRAFAESPYLGDIEMLHLLKNEFNGSTRARLQAKYGFRVYC